MERCSLLPAFAADRLTLCCCTAVLHHDKLQAALAAGGEQHCVLVPLTNVQACYLPLSSIIVAHCRAVRSL